MTLVKETLAIELAQAIEARGLSIQQMSQEMKISLAQLESVPNPKSGNVTLATMQKAANAVGKSLRVELV